MRLLVVTQTIDRGDPVLGFMHGWLSAIATKCDHVIAVGLRVGDHDLPKNVEVHSLGKERRRSRSLYVWNFYRYVWQHRRKYDAVLVHMNHEYVLLGGFLWRLWGKRIALWYAHGHVPWTLRIAESLVHSIVTSTPRGFRVPSKKLHVIGQGIDLGRFTWVARRRAPGALFRLIVVGRLSPVKDIETTLRAVASLVKGGGAWELDVIGEETQAGYRASLEALASTLGISAAVRFAGALPNDAVAERYAQAHCFVHSSRTGSFDKAAGEALATGLPIVSSSEALREVLGAEWETGGFPQGDCEAMARRIRECAALSEEAYAERGARGRAIILRSHDLSGFAERLHSAIEGKTSALSQRVI